MNGLDTQLHAAAQLRLEGRIAEALDASGAVAAQGGGGQAHALKAACLAELGEASEALAEINRALDAAPDDVWVALYESAMREFAGDADAALDAARRAARLDPDLFQAWGRLGDLAGGCGVFEEAAEALERALTFAPDHDGLRLRLAGAYMVLERFDAVRGALDALSREAAADPDAARLRLALAHRGGDWTAMAREAEAVLTADPSDQETVGALAYALGQQGYYNKASSIYRPVVEARGDDASAWAALARLRLGARDLDDAQACLEQALSLDPACADALFAKARLCTIRGALEEAGRLCRETLKADPEHFEAYGLLSEVASGTLTEEERSRLEVLSADSRFAADKRAIGLFALGDARRKAGEHPAAFSAWRAANEARLSMIGPNRPGYDGDAQARRVERLKALFAAPVEAAPAVRDGPTPIFIVGMPRSGTTLLEAILAAHDKTAPGGELPVLPRILDECLDWAERSGWRGGSLPADRLAAWRERYLAQYRTFSVPEASFVTDKQPSNVFAVGLIRQLFPHAPILHIRRNPVETGFSIYRRNFSQQWPFADRLEDIAHYYAGYSDIAEHWEAEFSRAMLTVQYEDLVTDFEAGVRKALAWSRLDFQSQCLRYYEVERAVMTFSAAQVRKPPSPEHLVTTAPYQSELEPLRVALSDQGVDLETGALAQDGGEAPVDMEGPPRRSWLERLGLARR